MKKRGADLSKLTAALQALYENQTLPGEHTLLFGEYNGLCDAHISPDWILLYEIQGDRNPFRFESVTRSRPRRTRRRFSSAYEHRRHERDIGAK